MGFLSADNKHSVAGEAGHRVIRMPGKNLFAFNELGNDSRALHFWKKTTGMGRGREL